MMPESADARGDRDLGMDRKITRREFVDGVAVTIGGVALAGSAVGGLAAALAGCGTDRSAALQTPSLVDYPPALTEMRGQTNAARAVPHMLKDGVLWDAAGSPEATGESYDVVIVGAGLSGLSAAYLYSQQSARSSHPRYSTTTTTSAAMRAATSSCPAPGGSVVASSATEAPRASPIPRPTTPRRWPCWRRSGSGWSDSAGTSTGASGPTSGRCGSSTRRRGGATTPSSTAAASSVAVSGQGCAHGGASQARPGDDLRRSAGLAGRLCPKKRRSGSSVR